MPAAGRYRLVGRTRDDAAGEAYDKVAKLLGLGYPGGPVVDKLARDGNDTAVDLPIARMTHADRNAPHIKGDLDFSFSGLKTAVLRHVRHHPSPESRTPLGGKETADICASFQRAVVEALLDRTFEAARKFGAESVGIAGGVSANSRLRHDAATWGGRAGVPVFVPLAGHGQCGDDCRRRPPNFHGRHGTPGPERRSEPRAGETRGG